MGIFGGLDVPKGPMTELRERSLADGKFWPALSFGGERRDCEIGYLHFGQLLLLRKLAETKVFQLTRELSSWELKDKFTAVMQPTVYGFKVCTSLIYTFICN